MTAADQTLSVRFEADVSELRAALADVSKRVKAYEQAAEGAADRSSRAMSGSARAIMTALGRIAATVVSVQTAMRMAQSTNAIHDNAQAIGVSTQSYQEWMFAAKAAGVTQEQFTTAITRFTTQIAQVRVRQGEFNAFLLQSAPALRAQLLATNSNQQAFEVFAEAVGRMTTEEQRALLVKRAFGEEAWRMQQALQGGVAGLEEASRRARELGLILDQETIEQTRRMSREIDRASDAVFAFGQRLVGVGATGFNQLLANLKRVTEEANKAAEATGNALNGRRLRERGPMSGEAILRRWRELNGQMPPLELQPRPDTRGRDFLTSMAGQLSQARGRAREVIELEEIQAFNNLDKLRSEDAIDEGRYQQARALIIQGTEVKRIELARGTERTLAGFRISALEASGHYYAAIKAQYEQDVRDLELQLGRQLITQQQFETARANMAAVAAERTRLQRRSDAENIAEQLSAYRAAVEGNIEAFTRGQTTARAFFQSLLSDISAAITKMLVLKPLMDGLFGTGKDVNGNIIGGGGIIGGLIGSVTGKPLAPQRAEGGPVMAGVPYLINERTGRRPEVFVPSVPGNMVPGERAGGMGRTSGVVNNYVDARYSDTGVEDRIFSALARAEAKRPSAAAQAASYARRFPVRKG